MNSKMRILAAILLVALVGIGYAVVKTKPSTDGVAPKDEGVRELPAIPKLDKPMDLRSSEECAECHKEIYDEWKGSQHEFAWLNPEPRRKDLSDDFKKKDCIPCHAPRPLLEVGFGKRALERETRREDGVNCFTCHRHNNTHVGTNPLSSAAKNAPCNPVEWKPLGRVLLCTPCHDQHKVEQDWKLSRFADKNSPEYKDCNDCHMPVVDGPGTKGSSRKTHRHHGFLGGHDAGMVKTSATLRAVKVESGDSFADAVQKLTGRSWRPKKDIKLSRGLFIEVKNTGVGHNFPADERHRAVDLVAKWRGANAKVKEDGVRLTRFRNPYRHEFENLNPFKDKPGIPLTTDLSWRETDMQLTQVRILPDFNPNRKVFYPESTQLHAGESRFLWFEVPEWGKGSIELTLYYKLQPFLKDEEAKLVTSITVEY